MTGSSNSHFPTKERLGLEFQRLLDAEASAAPSRERRRLFVLAPVAGLLLAIVAGVLLLGPGSENGSVGPASAEAALSDLADKVDTGGTELTMTGNELLFQREYGSGGQINFGDSPGDFYVAAGTYGERIAETWTDREGEAWIRITDGRDASQDIQRLQEPSEGFAFLDRPLSYDETIALPRDPEVLYQRLSSETSDSQTMISRLQILLDRPLPADLQAALTEAAAKIPGASLVGDVKTPFGDTLTAVSYPTGQGVHWELLFDPASGAYRGRTIVLPQGARLYDSLVFDRTVVSDLGEAPEGGVSELPAGAEDREEAATRPAADSGSSRK